MVEAKEPTPKPGGDTSTPPKPRRVERVKEHLATPRAFQVKHWMLYVCGAIVLLALIFGGIQQFRVWRYNRILKASKIRINELSSRVQTAKLEGMREVAKSQHKFTRKEVKKINKQIKEQEQKRVKLKKSIGRMKPSDLLRAFKEEGF